MKRLGGRNLIRLPVNFGCVTITDPADDTGGRESAAGSGEQPMNSVFGAVSIERSVGVVATPRSPQSAVDP